MNDIDFDKLLKLIDESFLEKIIKRGRREKENGEGLEVFSYVDLVDLEAYDLNEIEEEFIVEVLHQRGVIVYDNKGNEYHNQAKLNAEEPVKVGQMSIKEMFEKLKLLRETKDANLREEIILGNMYLVKKLVEKLVKKYSFEAEELEQYGYEGLIKFVDEFDIKTEKNFYQYVYQYIERYMIWGMIENCRDAGQKKRIMHDYFVAKKQVQAMDGQTLEENSNVDDEVVNLMMEIEKSEGIKVDDKYRSKINTNIVPISLDEFLLNKELSQSLSELLIDKAEIFRQLNAAINQLSEREQSVIRLRFGLEGVGRTLVEVGQIIGCSDEVVRRIENKAIRKIRFALYQTVGREMLDEYLKVIGYSSEFYEEEQKYYRK